MPRRMNNWTVINVATRETRSSEGSIAPNFGRHTLWVNKWWNGEQYITNEVFAATCDPVTAAARERGWSPSLIRNLQTLSYIAREFNSEL